MPNTKAEDFIAKLQQQGVLLLVDGKFYFIPKATLDAQYILPDEFQSGYAGVSADYFDPGKNLTDDQKAALTHADVYGQFKAALDGNTFNIDGVQKAISLDEAKASGVNWVSKAPGSKGVVFAYRQDKKRILVDGIKGGRPSNR